MQIRLQTKTQANTKSIAIANAKVRPQMRKFGLHEAYDLHLEFNTFKRIDNEF